MGALGKRWIMISLASACVAAWGCEGSDQASGGNQDGGVAAQTEGGHSDGGATPEPNGGAPLAGGAGDDAVAHGGASNEGGAPEPSQVGGAGGAGGISGGGVASGEGGLGGVGPDTGYDPRWAYSDELDSPGAWVLELDPDGETASGTFEGGKLRLVASQAHQCPRAGAVLELPQLQPLSPSQTGVWRLSLDDIDVTAMGNLSIELEREPFRIVIDPLLGYDDSFTAAELEATVREGEGLVLRLNGVAVTRFSATPYQGPARVRLLADACTSDPPADAQIALERLEIETLGPLSEP